MEALLTNTYYGTSKAGSELTFAVCKAAARNQALYKNYASFSRQAKRLLPGADFRENFTAGGAIRQNLSFHKGYKSICGGVADHPVPNPNYELISVVGRAIRQNLSFHKGYKSICGGVADHPVPNPNYELISVVGRAIRQNLSFHKGYKSICGGVADHPVPNPNYELISVVVGLFVKTSLFTRAIRAFVEELLITLYQTQIMN